jgi:segregation and condensation protein B
MMTRKTRNLGWYNFILFTPNKLVLPDYSMPDPTLLDKLPVLSGENPSGLRLSARIEALLFAAPSSVTLVQLATALEISVSEVEKSLVELQERYNQGGLRLQRHQSRVQLTTAPEAAQLVERFLGLDATSRLSRAALETLAMIAYQQPVTRPEIDAVRGVNSDGVLKSLLNKGLIQETGRAERPGRPILYSTTPDFLQHFGLNSLDELPPLQNTVGETANEDIGNLLKT